MFMYSTYKYSGVYINTLTHTHIIYMYMYVYIHIWTYKCM